MRADEVYKIFLGWKDNEFEHFRNIVEKRTFWILTTMVTLLGGMVTGLVILLVK